MALCTALLSGGASAQITEPGLPMPLPSTPDALWEGAIGMIATYRPEYQGATERIVKFKPVVFLRYDRFTVSSGGSSFGTKRAGDIGRGLSLSVHESDRVRVSLGLRYDGGRDEAESGALAGLGDIPPTLRARLGAAWRLKGPWRLGASWSIDMFGRGGGSYGELSAGWEQSILPRTVLTLGGNLSVAGDRYMQTYYGVSEAQAANTAYPVYEPAAGLREVTFSAGLRHQLSQEWTLVTGLGLSRLLGPAAASPLTISPSGWGINAGAVWRF
ncbi:MAG: MipA/OmpV family protein [Rubrivivax sp.]|nr:MipA/OmpV family protein [Rubrivivax sp.]